MKIKGIKGQKGDQRSCALVAPQVLPKLSLSVLSEVEHLLGNKALGKKEFRC